MQPGDLTTIEHVREWLNLGAAAIAGITNESPYGTVTLQAPAAFLVGMPVQFSDVEGMTEVNGNAYRVVRVVDTKTFQIAVDTFQFGAYSAGGFASVSDVVLTRLITAVSTYIQSWLNRTIRNLPYTEVRSGQGSPTMALKNFPVTSVTSVQVNGVAIPARSALGPATAPTMSWSGYVFDDYRVMLSGWNFWRGWANVTIDYAAGFLVSDEAQSVPATAPYTLTTRAHWNAGDRGVTYADGTPLTAVAVGAITGPGMYSCDADGVYTFDVGDAGAAVLISYGYVPPDLEQAAVDMIGDWFLYRDRIGTLSKAIEGQSITFTNSAITARAQGVLNQYKNVAPIW